MPFVLFARLAPGRDVVALEFSGRCCSSSAQSSATGRACLITSSSRVRWPLAHDARWIDRHRDVLGGLVVMAVFRPPFVDTRAVGAFHVHLQDERSAMQELGLLTVPIEKIDVRLGMHDPNGRSGVVSWHLPGRRVTRDSARRALYGSYQEGSLDLGLPRLQVSFRRVRASRYSLSLMSHLMPISYWRDEDEPLRGGPSLGKRQADLARSKP